MDLLSQERLYNFLAQNGYDISNKNLVNGAERHLRALVNLDAPTRAVNGPPVPDLKASAQDDHRNIDGGWTDDQQIIDGGGKEVEQQLHFYYLYDSMVYSGGPPVPGRSTAVECLTRYRHKDCEDWSIIPFNHQIPRINDEHDEDAAEKESRDYVDESALSGSDFSDTMRIKRGQRREDDTSEGDSSVQELDVVEDGMVSNVLHGAVKSNDGGQDLELAATVKVQRLQGSSIQETVEPELNSMSDHEKRRGRPSKEQLAEVNDLEVHIHAEVAGLARKWGVGLDVIFDQLGLGGVGVKKDETLWNTVLKVCSLTVPSNGNHMFSFLPWPIGSDVIFLRQRLDADHVGDLP